MSRSAATFTFADGEVFYGLHNNTVGMYCPLIYRTKAERDLYWKGYSQQPFPNGDHEPCGCPGEAVRTGPEYDQEKYLPEIQGNGCKQHGKFFGPYEDDCCNCGADGDA